jgi:hypothetical protein
VGNIEARGELEYLDSLLEDLDSTIILRDGTGDDATHEVGNDEGEAVIISCAPSIHGSREGGVGADAAEPHQVASTTTAGCGFPVPLPRISYLSPSHCRVTGSAIQRD